MAANEDNSWRTPAFRQSVVTKIEEAIRNSGMPTSRNSMEMESHVFQKAKNKEEYLGFVARLILHVRELNAKKGTGTGGAPIQGVGQGANPHMVTGMSAGPGTQMQQMQGQVTQQGQQIAPGMMMGQMMGQQAQPGVMPGQPQPNLQQGQMSPAMQQFVPRPGGQPMQGMPNRMPPSMGIHISQMGGYQVQSQSPQQIPNQLAQQMAQLQQQQAQHRKQAEMAMAVGPSNQPPFGPRAATPNQGFLGQSPNPSANQASVPSPAGTIGSSLQPGQLAGSPAMVASPSPQIGTPMGGPPGSVGPSRPMSMVASPSSSLNTPAVANLSPCSSQEEQVYREKVRQLSKYIEPLRKMIAKIGDEDAERHKKMKNLLELLSNPTKRMPLETLLKCEKVLEKLDFKRGEVGGSVPTAPHLAALREQHLYNPLLEAVGTQLNSPVINHTLQRTFEPTLEALLGTEIKLMPPPPKRRALEPIDDIPEVLQGEIARLDQRFKVSQNPNQHPGSQAIHLICWLDDRFLPCVPPICLTVPEDYPASPPKCDLAADEYASTPFLTSVEKALAARIHKLPGLYSVSQLLDTWEMAVRQASSPAQNNSISSITVLVGM
ncbi:mediator of RNA polymerase II transcription subunit 15 isoform X2 [Neocloeon triangulifer]|uniref:mediator of RNA polymerase II transcription subunit 15 isoform X2 n=1 Tax=Neocloeon triangulifer TaxID=2078957 RepID=UPI00286EC8B7|nr:mediator of RNA polymerase II transcription subunit 15 isoform X2 [Neocloeon triangulifer]